MAMSGHDARAAKDVFFSVFSFRANWVKLITIQFARQGTGAAAVDPATRSPLTRCPVDPATDRVARAQACYS